MKFCKRNLRTPFIYTHMRIHMYAHTHTHTHTHTGWLFHLRASAWRQCQSTAAYSQEGKEAEKPLIVTAVLPETRSSPGGLRQMEESSRVTTKTVTSKPPLSVVRQHNLTDWKNIYRIH